MPRLGSYGELIKSVGSGGIWMSGEILLEGLHRLKQFSMTDLMSILPAVKCLSINFTVGLTILTSLHSCFKGLFFI